MRLPFAIAAIAAAASPACGQVATIWVPSAAVVPGVTASAAPPAEAHWVAPAWRPSPARIAAAPEPIGERPSPPAPPTPSRPPVAMAQPPIPHAAFAAPARPVAASAPAIAAPPAPAHLVTAPTPGPPPAAGAGPRTYVRFYSLHRAYGLTPDPDPAPRNRPLVLIGPPDPPAQAKDDADASDGHAPAN